MNSTSNSDKNDDGELDYETADEAYDLLQNGILVETSKGLICMSLTDALSSADLNLSEEDLKNVATELILQQNVVTPKHTNNINKERVYLKTTTLNFDSDGFSSECSDISATSASSSSNQSTFITFTTDNNQIIESKDNIIILDANLIKPDPHINETKPTNNDNNKQFENAKDNQQQPIDVHKKPSKGRGGWPKGRKRKPELLNLPPKAPTTGYNLYLNEQRQLFKDTTLVFHEITKIIGNKWSNLSLEEKQPYLMKAEEDKRRYREELKQYRQSDAYRAYLLKKRKDRLQNNVLSESDMDATDEIDEEDNEELYCRVCDQWFHNLHNKREHLQGKQHTQTLAGEMKRELDDDRLVTTSTTTTTKRIDISITKSPRTTTTKKPSNPSSTVTDCVMNLMTAVTDRENEIKVLEQRLEAAVLKQTCLHQQLDVLKQRQHQLHSVLNELKLKGVDIEDKVTNLWQVPSLFIKIDEDTSHSDENC